MGFSPRNGAGNDYFVGILAKLKVKSPAASTAKPRTVGDGD